MKALKLSVLSLIAIAAMANTQLPAAKETEPDQKCGITNTAFKAEKK